MAGQYVQPVKLDELLAAPDLLIYSPPAGQQLGPCHDHAAAMGLYRSTYISGASPVEVSCDAQYAAIWRVSCTPFCHSVCCEVVTGEQNLACTHRPCQHQHCWGIEKKHTVEC